MIKKMIFLFFLIPIFSFLFAEDITFEKYFTPSTMRIDYYHIGDADSEFFALDKVYEYNTWAGVRNNLLSPLDLGRYRAIVYDKVTNQITYITSFDSYFGEYATTGPAKAGILKAFHESVLIPYPKNKITFVIERRDKKNIPHRVFSTDIDPEDINIIKNNITKAEKIYPVVISGPAENNVDLIFISEGYTEKEELKFENDLKKFTKIFFEWEPYASHRDRFNVTGILVFSSESGVDEPRQDIFKNTALDLSFNALGIARYLLTESNQKMRDIASQVPYDAIFIMANSERYGGSGIFNQFCIFTTDAPWNEHLLHHEFGHAFAGLADEYFDSSVAYEDFYTPGIEPLAPNITALLDPSQLKWQDFISPGLEIPTPWGKDIYDSLTTAIQTIYQSKRDTLAALKEKNADKETITRISREFDQKRSEVHKHIEDFYDKHPLKGKVGAFEGAGYNSEGFYRPTINSIMHRFSASEKKFYPVNENAIVQMILYYCD
jgi:hypothetical protein